MIEENIIHEFTCNSHTYTLFIVPFTPQWSGQFRVSGRESARFLECVRKLEKTDEDTGKTCKLHTEFAPNRISTGDLLALG